MGILHTRLMVVALVVAALITVLTGRLFYIQVVKASEYSARSRNQSQHRTVLVAPRGQIRDLTGVVLARGIERKLGTLPSGLDAGDGMPLQSYGKRVYPYGDLAGTVLGYVGKDGAGLAGIEYQYDRYLRGRDGWAILMRDARNVKYARMGLPIDKPMPGADVYLTVDVRIQNIAHTVLAQTVADFGARGGMCMVMEPSTGAILAMADYPGFNPNFPSAFPLERRLNRCIGAIYEPGSTFKVVTSALALQEDVERESNLIDGRNGVYKIYDTMIRDHKPYGIITFADALALSSNVCFAQVAQKIGNDRLYKYVKNFGFGARTGVDLPGEEDGLVRPVSAWSGRTAPTMAIGQEISATLLQMMQAYASVANGGVMVAPHIVARVVAADGSELYASRYQPVRRVISTQTARRLSVMMQGVVSKGTGTRAAIDGVLIAGKTGTSQKVDTATGAYSMSSYWSSFIGFAPADKPLLLCGISIDEPSAGQTGGMAAAPAFGKVIRSILSDPSLDYAERMLPAGVRSGDTLGSSESVVAHASVIPARPARSAPATSKGTVHNAADQVVRQNVMPDCVGEDARSAAASLLRRSIAVYVNRPGVVRSQSLPVGATTRSEVVCTLYCSLGG